MKTEYNITSMEQLTACCKDIKESIELPRVFALHGEMGSGKTTFVTQFIKLIDAKFSAQSPTYAIVNEYLVQGQEFLHFDLYRLQSIEEAFDIGIEDYLYRNSTLFIEWPALIESLLPKDAIHICIKNNTFTRTLTLSV